MKKVSLILAASVLSISSLPALAQEVKEDDDVVNVTGSIQSDILFPQADATIGAEDYPEAALTNSFAEVNVTSKHGDAGARFEYLEHPLPGFEPDYKGYGVPFFYVRGHWDKFEMTLIRPLCLVEERELQQLAVWRAYRRQDKVCPYESASTRRGAKELLAHLEGLHPDVRRSLWSSLSNVQADYLPRKIK